MRRPRVRKQIVCPECGRVLKTVWVPTAVVEQELVPDENGSNDAMASPADGAPGTGIEVIVEEGPVCPRCAGT